MKYPKYTEAEIEFLREYYPTHGFKDTYRAFCERFGEYTEPQVKHRLKKHHITSNNDSKFKKGHTTWNKGMSIKTERPDLYEMYREVNKNNLRFADHTYRTKPIGSEYIDKNRVMLKIADNTWVSKSRYMYEKYHNIKLTDDDKIIHLDGNNLNFDEENLFCADLKTICLMNRFKLWSEYREITKASVLTQMIRLKIKEIENENKV